MPQTTLENFHITSFYITFFCKIFKNHIQRSHSNHIQRNGVRHILVVFRFYRVFIFATTLLPQNQSMKSPLQMQDQFPKKKSSQLVPVLFISGAFAPPLSENTIPRAFWELFPLPSLGICGWFSLFTRHTTADQSRWVPMFLVPAGAIQLPPTCLGLLRAGL